MRKKSIRRSGLTVLEFVGCVVATVGGIWLGAIYLGIDVRHLAHAALAEAGLLEQVPDTWRPPGPADSTRQDELATALRDEFGTLREEVAALRSGEAMSGDAASRFDRASQFGGAGSPTDAVDTTRAYWQRLGEIAHQEAALQKEADAAFDKDNAAHVFGVKARVSRFAARSVAALREEKVDPSVLDFGERMANWFDRRGDLYEQAVQIWELPTDAQGRAALNEQWSRTDRQHRNEARLLREKAAAVRGMLSRRFGDEFLPLAEMGRESLAEPIHRNVFDHQEENP